MAELQDERNKLQVEPSTTAFLTNPNSTPLTLPMSPLSLMISAT